MFKPPLFITDPKTGKKSVTLTAFVIGFLVVNIKLIFAGVSIGSFFKMSDFSGTDYGVAIAAIGAIYIARKNKTINPDKDGTKNDSN